MDAKPKRRWYQFSLRTFFVLVTIFCVGFGYWVHWSQEWIRQRREWRDAHPDSIYLRTLITKQDVAPPLGLGLFGERGAVFIWCQKDDVESIRRLYPEAAIGMRDDPEREKAALWGITVD